MTLKKYVGEALGAGRGERGECGGSGGARFCEPQQVAKIARATNVLASGCQQVAAGRRPARRYPKRRLPSPAFTWMHRNPLISRICPLHNFSRAMPGLGAVAENVSFQPEPVRGMSVRGIIPQIPLTIIPLTTLDSLRLGVSASKTSVLIRVHLWLKKSRPAAFANVRICSCRVFHPL
jgi:hypothetical protein